MSLKKWNYPITNKEMLSVIQSFEMWHHYLEGAKCYNLLSPYSFSLLFQNILSISVMTHLHFLIVRFYHTITHLLVVTLTPP